MPIHIGSAVFDGENREYTVLESIGHGGFGQVFKCRQRGNKFLMALKTLPALFSDPKVLSSFKNEAQMATEISHPNVIKYAFFHNGELYETLPPYILMEYADGGTVASLIEKQASNKEFLPNDILHSLFRQLIDGMEAINARLIHRDIKPENVVFCGTCPKITDFGLAKLVQEATRTSTFKGFGTLRYFAPEAFIAAEKNTIQMDIYSMGLVFYELATLKYPYSVQGGDPQRLMEAHLFAPIARPETHNSAITSDISQVITGMLEKKPSNRFKDWASVRAELTSPKSPQTPDSPLLERALQRRLQADTAARDLQLEAAKKQTERERFLKLVSAQFENEIMDPLRQFIAEFNSKYHKQKVAFSPERNSLRYSISMPSGTSIKIEIVPILSENFERDFTREDYGRTIRGRKVFLPHLRDKKVLAWGYISASDEKGYNLILAEQPGEAYGDWFILRNKMGWPADVPQRSEPFAFALNELEKEIGYIGAMHIYQTQVSDLDLSVLKTFISDYF